jgi:C-terminal processing protease CtpA/Prc
VLEIEGHPLKTMKPEEFAALKRLPPGTTITIRYRRTDAEPEEVKLVLIKG